MQISQNEPVTQTISVLLFERFSNHCLANAIEPFRAANTIAGQALYAWQFLSFSGGTVTSSSGLPVETQKWAEVRPGGDYLFIMPSYGFEAFATPKNNASIKAARARFTTLVAFDTGAWLLAAAGLLDGRKATIHWDEFARFLERFPDVDAVEDRYTLTTDLATCGGASTAIELALEFTKRTHTPIFAMEVAALFMHGDKLNPHDPLERRSADALVRNATALMRRRIEVPLKITALSCALGVDQRHLEAVFLRELHMTPRQVYKAIRLREARRLVALTNLAIAEIAVRCGYQNASAMTRAYRSEFGQPPQVHRRQD